MNLPHPLAAKKYNATLTDIKLFNPHLAIFRFTPDFAIPEFKAGQFVTIGLGSWEKRVEGAQAELSVKENFLGRRAYSVSTPIFHPDGTLWTPQSTSYLELYIALVLNGKDAEHSPFLTPRLFNLEPGDRLSILPKISGHYVLQDIRPTDNVLFFATGTGQAPHNAMAAELLSKGHSGGIFLIECNRTADMFGYNDKLEKLAAMFDNVFYKKLMTREGDAPMRIQQYVADGLLAREFAIEISPRNTKVFLCGNPAMIGIPDFEAGKPIFKHKGGMVEILSKKYGLSVHHGHTPGEIYYEKYW